MQRRIERAVRGLRAIQAEHDDWGDAQLAHAINLKLRRAKIKPLPQTTLYYFLHGRRPRLRTLLTIEWVLDHWQDGAGQ